MRGFVEGPERRNGISEGDGPGNHECGQSGKSGRKASSGGLEQVFGPEQL